MADTVIQSIDYIVKTPGICGGRARIDGTRLTVAWIVGQMLHAGQTLEEMVADYAHVPLRPAQIHAALAYYYDHQAEIDAQIADSERLMAEVRAQPASGLGDYISAKEAAEILGVDHASRHIAHLCREGKLACRKVANRWLISRASVEAYRDSERKPGPKPGADA
jgi:uncharacterized protein (DUF433 family)